MSYIDDFRQINAAAQLLADKVAKYTFEPAKKISPISNRSRTWSKWYNLLRKIEDELGVSFEVFVQAQIYFLDKWYNAKIDTLGYLLTDKAIVRCRKFCVENRKQQTTVEDDSDILDISVFEDIYGPAQMAPIPTQQDMDRLCEQGLASIVRNFSRNDKPRTWQEVVWANGALEEWFYGNEVWVNAKRQEALDNPHVDPPLREIDKVMLRLRQKPSEP